MAVVAPARDDVPMEMRGHIAETGEIDLVGLHRLAQRMFDAHDDIHQVLCLRRRKIAHFADMYVPDNPTVARKIRLVAMRDQHHATKIILPE